MKKVVPGHFRRLGSAGYELDERGSILVFKVVSVHVTVKKIFALLAVPK
jgi:hypothetical protein